MGIAKKEMSVQTDAGIVYGWRVSENRYRVKLNNPEVVDLQRKENTAYVELGNPGVPHGVTEVPELSWEKAPDLWDYAKSLRHDPLSPRVQTSISSAG